MKTPEAKAAEEADRVQLVEALAEHPGTPWGEAIGKVAELRLTLEANAAVIAGLRGTVEELRAELAYQNDRHGTRAEQEAEDREDAILDAEEAKLTDEQVQAELAEAGWDPAAATDRMFANVVSTLAKKAAAAKQMAADRDPVGFLSRLARMASEPLPCGHPIDCIPDHEPADAHKVGCGWCAAIRERDELRAALLNERGEGDPPSEGWTSCGDGGPIVWTCGLEQISDGQREVLDVEPNFDFPLTWTWWHRIVDEDGEVVKDIAHGDAPTAREAMRAADTALAGAKS